MSTVVASPSMLNVSFNVYHLPASAVAIVAPYFGYSVMNNTVARDVIAIFTMLLPTRIVDIKEIVSKKLEEARAEKVIGHSLNAKVTLYAEGDLYNFIKDNLKLLQSVFITSGVEVEENQRDAEVKLGVKVEQAEGEKCERCWMISKTVGLNKLHPTICKKCSDNLE